MMKKLLLCMGLALALLPIAANGQNTQVPIIHNVSGCDSVTINNETYYGDTTFMVNNPDTIHIYKVKVNRSYNITIAEPIIAGCSYTIGDKIYTESGSYTDTLPTEAQCDSIIHFDLVLTGHDLVYLDTVRVCKQYVWHDSTYTTSGLHHYHEVAGDCERDEYLPLQITGIIIAEPEVMRACGSKMWHGTNYTQSGTYIDTVRNEQCDTVHTLQLTVTKLDTVTNVIDTARCERMMNWLVTPQVRITSSTTVSKTFLHTEDYCVDSIVIAHITILQKQYSHQTVKACDKYEWAGKTYTYSIVDSVKADTVAKNGCDSIQYLHLTINPTPVVRSLEGKWHLEEAGMTATLYATSDQENVSKTWLCPIPSETREDTLIVPNVRANTDVQLKITNKESGCTSESWFTILVGVGIEEVEQSNVSIYPNPAETFINIESEKAIKQVTVYNVIGQQMIKQDGANSRVDLSTLSKGTYTIEIDFADGERAARKFVITK